MPRPEDKDSIWFFFSQAVGNPVSHPHPNQKISEEQIRAAALKFTTRQSFHLGASPEYGAAHRRRMLDAVCAHMDTVGSKHFRYVYSIELGAEIYIGLSQHPRRRWVGHILRGTKRVKDLISRGASLTVLSPLLPREEAARAENALLSQAKAEGRIVLNAKAGGGLGGSSLLWVTDEQICDEGRKHGSRSEFRVNANGAYTSALMRGLLDQIFPSGRNGWRKTLEGRRLLSRKAGGRMFQTINLTTGERQLWQSQFECSEALHVSNVSATLAGKFRHLSGRRGASTAHYTARYLSTAELSNQRLYIQP